MSHWRYYIKYQLKTVLPFFTIVSIIFVGVVLNWKEHPVSYFIAGFCIFLLLIPILDSIVVRYVEKVVTLIECEKEKNYFNCVFFDNENQVAIRFYYHDNPYQNLELHKNYKLLMHGKDAVELLGLAEEQTVQIAPTIHQSAISTLEEVENCEEKERKKQMSKVYDNVYKVMMIHSKIKGILELIVALPFLYFGFTGRVDPPSSVPLVIFFGVALVIAALRDLTFK